MTVQTSPGKYPRAAATALLAAFSLVLTGCFITPGKFTSELVVMKDDRFSYSYDGEIFFLGLSSLAKMGAAAEEFEPEGCYDEETYEDRECTEAELAQQRADWEANAEQRAAEAEVEAQQMAALMGGIDPSDPEATAELVRLLERQKGFASVVDKGDGVFDVRFAIEGDLSHDFLFPVIEGFPSINPFVQIHLRKNNLVRINAPGFAAQNDTNPMAGMMGGMAGLAGMAALGGDDAMGEQMPNIPTIDGTFTIITDGTIRANNTDEGATPTARGQELVWKVTPRTQDAPTALIDLLN